jgi:hypothetical protein
MRRHPTPRYHPAPPLRSSPRKGTTLSPNGALAYPTRALGLTAVTRLAQIVPSYSHVSSSMPVFPNSSPPKSVITPPRGPVMLAEASRTVPEIERHKLWPVFTQTRPSIGRRRDGLDAAYFLIPYGSRKGSWPDVARFSRDRVGVSSPRDSRRCGCQNSLGEPVGRRASGGSLWVHADIRHGPDGSGRRAGDPLRGPAQKPQLH